MLSDDAPLVYVGKPRGACIGGKRRSCDVFHAGASVSDLREYVVEGTSFNPCAGGIVGCTALTKNLEVCFHHYLTVEILRYLI